MSSRKLRFAFFGNTYQAKKSSSIHQILASLAQRKAEVCIERAFYDFLVSDPQNGRSGVSVFDGTNFDSDFVISMGGDGTLLKTAARVGRKDIPIVGVNIGRLGFLADVNPTELERAIANLYSGDYVVSEHAILVAESDGAPIKECPYALNDISVLKRDSASMIAIRTSVNDEYVVTYQADGLIVTTPMGSTAYSLSNGGPIITPETDIICLTPVAPHSLNVRPIVIPDNSVVTLKVESRSHNFLIAVDGRSESLPEGALITIRKADYTAKVVRFCDHRYFSTLREKMMWGADQR